MTESRMFTEGGKRVTETKIFSREWGKPGPGYAINPFKGCSANCAYCWARDMAVRFKRVKAEDWGKPTLKPGFAGLFPAKQLNKELLALPPGNVLISATCDLYDPAIPNSELFTQNLIKCLPQSGHTYWFLTKRAEVMRDARRLKFPDIHVGLSITGTEPCPQEPGTSPNPERIRALREIHEAGIWTFASIEPVMPGFTDIIDTIEAVAPYANKIFLGSLNKNRRPAMPEFYRRVLPEVLKWIEAQGLDGKVFIKPELRGCLND